MPEADATEPRPVASTVAAVADASSPRPRPPSSDRARKGLRSKLYLRGRRLRLPKSKAGLFALLLVLSGVGLVGDLLRPSRWSTGPRPPTSAAAATRWPPSSQAYHAGNHRDVACGECHVSPGHRRLGQGQGQRHPPAGRRWCWARSPRRSTRPTTRSCRSRPTPARNATTSRARSWPTSGPRTSFSEDEANTRQFVGLMIRPGGGDVFDIDRGVHWHVVRDGRVLDARQGRRDDRPRRGRGRRGGCIQEYIAQDKITRRRGRPAGHRRDQGHARRRAR